MVRDIDEDTVDFRPNYDGRSSEPVLLPARFPNLLVNGFGGDRGGDGHQHPAAQSAGSGGRRPVGRWQIPTPRDEELLEELLQRIPGPDFPTGALIVGRRGIEDAYRTGRGSVTMRASRGRRGRCQGTVCLVVTQLPYQVNPDNLALKIAELADSGKVQGIADVRDDSSSRTGQRLVVVLKRDAIARVVLNNLTSTRSCRTRSAATCWPSSMTCRGR